MLHNRPGQQNNRTFYSFLPFFLCTIGLMLGLGSGAFIVGMQTSNYWWWSITVFAALVASRIALRYATQRIKFCASDVIFHPSIASQPPIKVPLWYFRPEIDQSLLGKLFNYGTVRQQLGNELIEMRMIGQLDAFRQMIP